MGAGPGNPGGVSVRAKEILESVDVVVGYGPYLDLIEPVIRGKKTLSTGMTREVDRGRAAIDMALEGTSCALVSGGDPGVYAMAGLVLEMCARGGIALAPGAPQGLHVEVIPGIPALCAGAAVLGAPLTHDFAAVSLSDLLTPWDTIEKRVRAASMADFVLVIYNPKSKKRDWQLGRVREILLEHRPDATPVGIVRGAMRDSQAMRLCTLWDMHLMDVDMQTIVFVGASATFFYGGRMITPRGYDGKYAL